MDLEIEQADGTWKKIGSVTSIDGLGLFEGEKRNYPRNRAIEDAATMEQLGREAYRLHFAVHDACQLLAKYRQHVQDCESIDFLDQFGESDVTFTPAEKAALMALRKENNHG